jgi:PKD repeat protein
MTKNIHKILSLLLALLAVSVLTAAQGIVPGEKGYFYTDSLHSRIYYTGGKTTEILLSGPGVGYFTVSPDERYIGFKYREHPGGLEQAAIYDLKTKELIALHEPVYNAGQVSFADDGSIAYTVENTLYVIHKGNTNTYDLGYYANTAPISPNAQFVVFNDKADQLWTIDLHTGVREKISQGEYGNVFPTWSKNSRHIAYSCLDGSLKIFDRTNKSIINLGDGGGFVWSNIPGEYAFTKIYLNEKGSIQHTDIIHSTVEGEIIIETNTPVLNEKEPYFDNKGELLFLNDGKISSLQDVSIFGKKNFKDISFDIDPITFDENAPEEDYYLDVPYINQVYDTPGSRGYSSCAPTTAAMVLAYYGLLPKWPFVSGFGNTSDYGAYVHERYYYNGNYFGLVYNDCNSSGSYCYTTYGGMGYMWTNGTPNSRMAGYYNKHGVSTNQTWNTNWTKVAAEIDKKQPFSICNFLSSSGHLIVGLGRAENGQRTVIANDPYGDRNEATWPNYNGDVVRYDWPGYNYGHASLNYANSGYSTMPWCIATSYTTPACVDSIVDDKQFDDGFYMKAEGNTVPMRYYHSSNSGFGGHHWWTYSEEGEEDICFVTWTPRVDNGYYEIKAYIPANASASSAIYHVHHAAGKAQVLIDQNSNKDSWVSLGKYFMRNDGSDYLYLGDSTGISGEKITFDAIKWTPASQEELDIYTNYTRGYPNYDINFSVISDLPEGNYEYSWDFGDGGSAMGDSIKHRYNEPGNYTISLTASANGIKVSKVYENMITIRENTSDSMILISPDSMSVIKTNRPVLSWAPNANTYSVFVSETPEFSNNDLIAETDADSFAIDFDLPENKTIYWKIYGDSDDASKVWVFKINTINSNPAPFDLISPLDQNISDTLRPVFNWASSSDRDPDDTLRYKLFIGRDIDSLLCIYEGFETNFQMMNDLNENETYYWFVEALDQTNAVTRSTEDYREISINSINEAPSKPIQILPSDNSYQSTRYPYLEWTIVHDPDPGDNIHYEVEYWIPGITSVFTIWTTENYHDQRRFRDQSEYKWTVAAIDDHDVHTYSDTFTVFIDTELDIIELPEKFALKGNYPNPFNPTTKIDYSVPVAENVTITIYDLSGKIVDVLVSGFHQAGNYTVQFDALGLPSGIYVYSMKAGSFEKNAKMLFLK